MNVNFRMLTNDPVMNYVEACKITQGVSFYDESLREEERPLDIYSKTVKDIFFQRQIDEEKQVGWFVKQIIANHSTLRCIRFRMIAEAPKSVIMQIIRATKGHPQPEVQSSRPDWVGKERSGDPYELKLFMQDHTAESFVEMAKQRLCMRTENKTREFMQKAVEALKQSGEPFLVAVGYCCKPYCDWYGSCSEIKSCGKSPSLSAWIIGEYKIKKDKKSLTL